MSVLLSIPVYNGASALEMCIQRIIDSNICNSPNNCVVVIVDNGSDDDTPDVAKSLVKRFPAAVDYFRMEERGRGRALRQHWLSTHCDIYAYMDVDLATEITCWNQLIKPLLNGEADLVVGSRRVPGARVVRTLLRRRASDVFHGFARFVLGVECRDLQCGFKALNRSCLPIVEATREPGWLFDTELIALAERRGARVLEIPVLWNEKLGSTVSVFRDSMLAIRGVLGIRRRIASMERARGSDLSRRL